MNVRIALRFATPRGSIPSLGPNKPDRTFGTTRWSLRRLVVGEASSLLAKDRPSDRNQARFGLFELTPLASKWASPIAPAVNPLRCEETQIQKRKPTIDGLHLDDKQKENAPYALPLDPNQKYMRTHDLNWH